MLLPLFRSTAPYGKTTILQSFSWHPISAVLRAGRWYKPHLLLESHFINIKLQQKPFLPFFPFRFAWNQSRKGNKTEPLLLPAGNYHHHRSLFITPPHSHGSGCLQTWREARTNPALTCQRSAPSEHSCERSSLQWRTGVQKIHN